MGERGLSAQIVEALPSEDIRAKFTELVDLMRLLGDSIISDNYSIPDAMNAAIILTPEGEALRNKVATARSDRIPAKEARLLCGLAIGQDRLFIDVDRTDLDLLRESISEQIMSGRIRFPFAFGRNSYDAYAEMFDEGNPVLTYAETIRFLDATPMGVHQYGRHVTGPYGLQRSDANRHIHSGRRVEAFHCSNSMCEVVHRVLLNTSDKASINTSRDPFNAALGTEDSKAFDWFGAADEIRDVPANMFKDTDVGVVATLLGDALTLDELRALVAHLLDETAGTLRKLVGPLIKVAAAEKAVAELGRAELLQISLLSSEGSLQRALDALVANDTIKVPRGEVRQPVVNRERKSGAFGLTPELSRFGVRFAAAYDDGFPTLRLKHELGSLTDASDISAQDELAWQIRDVEGETLAERLDTFFRVTDPAECIERLVMVSQSNVRSAAGRLGITQGLNGSDEEIVQRILWKLGYALHDEEDPRAEFWRLHERLSGLTKASHTPSSRDTEEFLGTASKFFRELERYLAESLAFTAWALLHDHSVDANPFAYGLESDYARGLEFVQEAADGADEVKTFDFLSEKLDIYTLIRGFEFLSKRLQSLGDEADVHRREPNDLPDYARGSELKQFPFEFTIPFLNLTQRSQDRLAGDLRNVARDLQRGKVNEIRNEHQHYRKTTSGVDQIESALRVIETSLRTLESSGFGLVEFRVEDAVHDRWGRSEYYFAAPRGARHVVTRPSSFDWLGMPELDASQYVVPGAAFAEPNEVLRFKRRLDSSFTQMWQDYPKRRKPRGSALSQSSVEHPGSDIRSNE